MRNAFPRETLAMLNLFVARSEESEEDAPTTAPDEQLGQVSLSLGKTTSRKLADHDRQTVCRSEVVSQRVTRKNG